MKATAPRPDIYEIITNRFILALENGVAPWKQPWNAAYGAPRNYRSGHVYQGVNAFLLKMVAGEQPFFLTYQQAQELGGQVRKGEKGMPIVFAKVIKKDKGEGKEEKKLYLQYSHVFNVSQIDGIEWKFPEVPTREHTPQQQAEQLLAGYPQGPRLVHAGSEAHYRKATDTVTVPEAALFHTAEDYYLTIFHECIHSTGHAKRLNRASLTEEAGFGSEPYALEELVAELGASYLSAAAGLNLAVTEQGSASYLANWLQALRNDKRLILTAAKLAQRATYHVLGTTPSYADEASSEA